jgi:hypothetical protein
VTDKPLRISAIVFSVEVFLDDNIIEHTRRTYGIMDLLGDMGGEIQILFIFCNFFLGSYNETSFIFKVINQTDYSFEEKKLTKGFCNKIGLHLIKSVDCMRIVLPRNILKLKKLHDECIMRLDDNLDIVNIIEMGERAKDVNNDKYLEDPPAKLDENLEIKIRPKRSSAKKVKSFRGNIV